MRLEVRVTVWLLVILGVGAAATLAGFARFQSHMLEQQSQETGNLLALSLRNSLEVGMLNNAPQDIERTVRNAQRGTLIKSVAVYRRSGSVWVSATGGAAPVGDQRRALLDAIDLGRPTTSLTDGARSIFVPVANQAQCARCHPGGAEILGAVGVTLDERATRRDLEATSRNALLVGTIPLLLGLLASLWAVRRSLLRPLASLGGAAERLAGGDLAVRLPGFSSRELDAVAQTFNDMAGRLQRQAADLIGTVTQLRSDLEGMEELQSLVASGAGLSEILARTAHRLGVALGAEGVAIWRPGTATPEADWGEALPADVRSAASQPAAEDDADGARRIVTSAGPLDDVDVREDVGWIVVPAARGGRLLARVAVTWDPAPRPLGEADRDLARLLTGVVAIALENAELLERLREKEETLQGLLKKTLAAREEERKHIARELHDETSQILHALLMNADLLQSERSASPELRARLEAVKALAEEAGRNVDKVMIDLRPALLDELGLVAALRWYVTQVRDAWGLPVEFTASAKGRLPEQVEVAAFRIVQEAVANAVRHAGARAIWVTVSLGPGALALDVRDDGVGFDGVEAAARARVGEAAGLVGMRERAELLGGRLVVESRPGAGTRIRAELPIPETGEGTTP